MDDGKRTSRVQRLREMREGRGGHRRQRSEGESTTGSDEAGASETADGEGTATTGTEDGTDGGIDSTAGAASAADTGSPGVGFADTAATEETPASVVEAQLLAYNEGDVDAFVDQFAEDAVVWTLGATDEQIRGREEIRETYGQLFEVNPSMRFETRDWLTVGNTVAVHEVMFLDDERFSDSLSVYQVQDGLITHLWLVEDV